MMLCFFVSIVLDDCFVFVFNLILGDFLLLFCFTLHDRIMSLSIFSANSLLSMYISLIIDRGRPTALSFVNKPHLTTKKSRSAQNSF